jgi:hypothetical protein
MLRGTVATNASSPCGRNALRRSTGVGHCSTVAPVARTASTSGPASGSVTVTVQPRSSRTVTVSSSTRSEPYSSAPGWAIRTDGERFMSGVARQQGGLCSTSAGSGVTW